MGPYGIIYANGNKLCDRDRQIHVEMMPPKNEHTVVFEKGSNDGNEAIRITGWMSIPMQCHELKKIDNGVNKIKIGVEKKRKTAKQVEEQSGIYLYTRGQDFFRHEYSVCQRRQIRVGDDDFRNVVDIEDLLDSSTYSLCLSLGPKAKVVWISIFMVRLVFYCYRLGL